MAAGVWAGSRLFGSSSRIPPAPPAWRLGSLSIRVDLLEEGLPKLVGADHDGTGGGHLDHPGHET